MHNQNAVCCELLISQRGSFICIEIHLAVLSRRDGAVYWMRWILGPLRESLSTSSILTQPCFNIFHVRAMVIECTIRLYNPSVTLLYNNWSRAACTAARAWRLWCGLSSLQSCLLLSFHPYAIQQPSSIVELAKQGRRTKTHKDTDNFFYGRHNLVKQSEGN
jgi:hypothetical protein